MGRPEASEQMEQGKNVCLSLLQVTFINKMDLIRPQLQTFENCRAYMLSVSMACVAHSRFIVFD